MDEPRSLEKLVKDCHLIHAVSSTPRLCLICTHNYIRRRVRATVWATLKHVITEISKFSRLPAQTDTAGIVRGILSAIRALKIKP